MHLPRRTLGVLLPLIGAIALVAAACGEEAKPQTFNVAVGGEDKNEAALHQTFLPSDLTVNVGDSIVFAKKIAEAHTITFNVPEPPPRPFIRHPDGRVEANPQTFFPSPPPQGPPPAPGASLNLSVNFDGTGYFSSGFLATENDVFKVTFTKAGKYPYLCLLHPTHMKGTITVSAAGTKYPKTAADYDKEAAEHLAKHKANAKVLFDATKAPAPEALAGGRRFVVIAGAGNDEQGNEFVRFIGGENLTIKAGDTVRWGLGQNVAGVPHTVTFLEHGEKHPDFVTPEPQPQGPPKLFVNPKVLAPAPTAPAPYAGTGYYNSGLLLTKGPTPQEYTLTFTKAGTYKYLCQIHDASGMNGTITVQ